MKTLSASEAIRRLDTLMDDAKQSREPVRIAGTRKSAVPESEEDWRTTGETLYLVSIPGMRESIKKGFKAPVEKCDEDPGW